MFVDKIVAFVALVQGCFARCSDGRCDAESDSMLQNGMVNKPVLDKQDDATSAADCFMRNWGCKDGWKKSCCEGTFCDTSQNYKNITGAGLCAREVNAVGDSVLCGDNKACVIDLAGPTATLDYMDDAHGVANVHRDNGCGGGPLLLVSHGDEWCKAATTVAPPAPTPAPTAMCPPEAAAAATPVENCFKRNWGCKDGWRNSCCEGTFCDTSQNYNNITGAGLCAREVNAIGDSVLCGGNKACVIDLAGPTATLDYMDDAHCVARVQRDNGCGGGPLLLVSHGDEWCEAATTMP